MAMTRDNRLQTGQPQQALHGRPRWDLLFWSCRARHIVRARRTNTPSRSPAIAQALVAQLPQGVLVAGGPVGLATPASVKPTDDRGAPNDRQDPNRRAIDPCPTIHIGTAVHRRYFSTTSLRHRMPN